ncbi:DUF4184 family protein [Phaeacidiphilus oryzae]|uniref:DUF4184 family protein n=1 Tax=Phaeacidiphilus oryzae TaxID=348818 RepID=UPI0006907A4C|nr:DUF4184 family protein [Phaeacidiphilus oryzae]
MPFTLSHPAAVLPVLGNRRLSATGLIAGSMAPDVPFFTGALVPWSYVLGDFSHRLAGVLTLDLAMAAGLAALWRFVRMPLLALFPPEPGGRLALLTRPRRPLRPGAVEAARFAGSAMVGAGTHVLWDDFTHPDRLGSRLLPVLDRPLDGVRIAWWLQYGTSALALLLMAWLLLRGLRGIDAAAARSAAPARPVRQGPRVLAVVLLVVAVGMGLAAGWHRYRTVGGVGYTPLDPVSVLSFYAGAAVVCWSIGYAAAARMTALHQAGDERVRMPDREREPERPAA